MLVFVTNEDDVDNKVVTPIRLVLPNGQTSTSFRGRGEVIDIGFIPLPMTRNDMMSDSNSDGVEDIPREIKLADRFTSSIEISLDHGHSLLDSDGNGIVNDYEDMDGDRKPNRDGDGDGDGDGIKDSDDNDHDNGGQNDNDLDGDGVPNREDVDDDNDGELDEDEDDEDSSGDLVTPVSGPPSAGRLLAAQCAQCHGTDGHSVSGIDSLAGEGRSEIIEEMLEMHSEGDRDIMSLQARGYSRAEIQQLAEYLGSIQGGDK